MNSSLALYLFIFWNLFSLRKLALLLMDLGAWCWLVLFALFREGTIYTKYQPIIFLHHVVLLYSL